MSNALREGIGRLITNLLLISIIAGIVLFLVFLKISAVLVKRFTEDVEGEKKLLLRTLLPVPLAIVLTLIFSFVVKIVNFARNWCPFCS